MPDADDDADAVDALTGVGHDLPAGGAEAAARETRADGVGEAARADPGAAAPARPTQPADDDESAKMLMLLGELGGAGDCSADEEEEEEEEEEEGEANGAARGSGRPGSTRRNGGNGGNGASARGGGLKTKTVAGAGDGGVSRVDLGSSRPHEDPDGVVGGAGQSGPVGEWLKAEGEARMKMADHRRLIYRWTNAVYRLLGMKIPRGMGSLFDKGEKNKREKFDRFLSYYYGTETFEPGTYWYNNADTIQFFVELIRVATCDRYVPAPATVQRLFRKKDPTRQASTWIMVPEELEKTDVTADELRALFEGEPRVVRGYPRGRPLFVPIPRNPKGHHKYTRGEGGDAPGGGPASPQPNPRPAARSAARAHEKGGSGGKRGAPGSGAAERGGGGGPAGATAAAAAAQAQAAQAMASFGAVGATAQQQATALTQSHQAALLGSLSALGARFGLTEAQMGQLGQFSGLVGGSGSVAAGDRAGLLNDRPTPGTLPAVGLGGLGIPGMPGISGIPGIPGMPGMPSLDPSSAAATRAAHRRATVAAAVAKARGFALGGAAGAGPADFSAVAAAQREAAAAAPGACERITLAPSPARRADARDARSGSALASPRTSKKRSGGRLEAAPRAPVRRLALPAPPPAPARPAPLPPPERLVGDVFAGALGAVLGGVFGHDVAFADDAHDDPSAFAAAGREKLMRLGEEVHDALPATAAPGSAPGGGGAGGPAGHNAETPGAERGRSTREPVADRTALGAEVDSVLVAARSAHSAWRRHRDAAARLAEAEAAARAARAALAAAADDAEGARMARDAFESDDPRESVARIMSGDTRVGGFVSALNASARKATALAVRARVDDFEATRAEKEASSRARDAAAAEARVASAACERTFKPAYEEVRKRALRLRLAAEERCERQIARVLSRAERDVAAHRRLLDAAEANARGEEKTKDSSTADAESARSALAHAESALSVIKRAMDGCKTATEWSKSEIAEISSGRDV